MLPAVAVSPVGVDGGAETLPILEDSVHRLHEQHASVGTALGR